MNITLKVISLLMFFAFLSCKEDDIYDNNYIRVITTSESYDFHLYESPNEYIYGPNGHQVSFYLLDENNFKCVVIISGVNFFEADFPVVLPDYSNPAFANIQIINKNIVVDTIFGENDDVNFYGVTGLTIQMEISGYKGGLIWGTFSGSIETGTGRKKKIDEGSFRVGLNLREND